MCKWEDFEKELETLINRKSMENYFDMPDFVLAENIVNYMKNLSETLDRSRSLVSRGKPVKVIDEEFEDSLCCPVCEAGPDS